MNDDQYNLTFLFYPDDEGSGKLVGHCLEMDIVALGDSIQECCKLLKELINVQLDAAENLHTRDTLFRPAPAKYWRMLARANKLSPEDIELQPREVRVRACVDSIKYNSLVPA
ncbi:hypothetical protein ACFL54_00960 [Planctomycetota bacterium]